MYIAAENNILNVMFNAKYVPCITYALGIEVLPG